MYPEWNAAPVDNSDNNSDKMTELPRNNSDISGNNSDIAMSDEPLEPLLEPLKSARPVDNSPNSLGWAPPESREDALAGYIKQLKLMQNPPPGEIARATTELKQIQQGGNHG